MRKCRGITLIVLVITIIVLVVLAGVSLSLIVGENGILKRATASASRTNQAKIQEEIEMAIMDSQVEELEQGRKVTLAYIKEKIVEKLEGITATLNEDQITGEYKEYDYTIYNDFTVKIGSKVTGVKPTGTAQVLTTGYQFGGTVEIKLKAEVAEGKIDEIIVPEGAILREGSSDIYEVSQNGNYVFKVVADSGREVNVTAKVENFLAEPRISIKDITKHSFIIQVENQYPEGVIMEYKYYMENTVKSEGTTNTSYRIEDLEEEQEYKNIKVEAYLETDKRESNIETVLTVEEKWSVVYNETQSYMDEYGNQAKIPKGFQVSEEEGQRNLTDGLVVRDAKDKNEFVWIPVGDVKQADGTTKTITLGRYFFASDGTPSDYSGPNIEENARDVENLFNYGNTIAKDIEGFKESVSQNGGYYIGRYEARKNEEGQVTEKRTDDVYHTITQMVAADMCQMLYGEDKPVISDLMNSYAWDTAITFVQAFDNRTTENKVVYSKQTSLNNTMALKGTRQIKDVAQQDKICNIWDMASNFFEWTTETGMSSNLYMCTLAGGVFPDKSYWASTRGRSNTGYVDYTAFRPILYLKN